MTFKSNDIHPAVRDSLRRLAALERRTPPGYPIGYTLHLNTWSCQGCGRTAETQLLWTVRRTGAHGKGYAVTGPNEKVYDLPVDTVHRHETTARCEWCITVLAREPVPAPPRPQAAIDAANHAPTLDAWLKTKPQNGGKVVTRRIPAAIDVESLFTDDDLKDLGLL